MNLDYLLKSLLALPTETEWVEFKLNNDAPEEIGEYLSALANSAALHGRDAGYIVWGLEDVTKRVVGTTANPRQKKIGNEEMENWLAHLLSPKPQKPAWSGTPTRTTSHENMRNTFLSGSCDGHVMETPGLAGFIPSARRANR
jgi:hypothetical protein